MNRALAVIIAVLSLGFSAAFAQNEQSPIVEKDFAYRDWTYKNVQTGSVVNLRRAAAGKKLVLVVYWAPWCQNWRYDAPFVRDLYDKYKGQGLEVIGVGEYDPLERMKEHIREFKFGFTHVYESVSSADREKTVHFVQRREAGDLRKWGSPWYVFLEPAKFEPDGPILQRKVPVANGELIRPDAERFIREKLGIAAGTALAVSRSLQIEACAPNTSLVKP